MDDHELFARVRAADPTIEIGTCQRFDEGDGRCGAPLRLVTSAAHELRPSQMLQCPRDGCAGMYFKETDEVADFLRAKLAEQEVTVEP